MMHSAIKTQHNAELLLQRLRSVCSLEPAEVDLLRSVRQVPRVYGAGAQISSDGEAAHPPRVITTGWACRPRILPDGRCQVLSILLPGDLVGDGGDGRPLAVAPVVALTAVRTINARPLFEAVELDRRKYRNLAAGLAQLNRLEEAQLLDHVVRLGRQTATQRVSHCLLELFHRLDTIGFVNGDDFAMPLTQETLGDVLGLSLVHVNRTLSQLKREELIKVRGGIVSVLDVERMALVADFTPPEAPRAPRAAYGFGARPKAA